jgi:hypothetical protein
LKICPFSPPDVEKEINPSGKVHQQNAYHHSGDAKIMATAPRLRCTDHSPYQRGIVWLLVRPIPVSFSRELHVSQSPGPAAGVNDTEVDRQGRTIVKILSGINMLIVDTLTYHQTVLTIVDISTEIPSFDSIPYQSS